MRLGVAAVVMLTFAGVVVGGQAKTDPALNKLTAELVAATNARDAAKVASFYAEDAVFMPPGESIVKGRANIEAYMKDSFKLSVATIQAQPIESVIAGNVAFEAGTSTVTMKRSGSATTGNVTGKYLVVFKRVGSNWKVAYDIFNLDPSSAPEKK